MPIGVLCQIVACFGQIVSYPILEKGGEGGWKRTFQCSVLLVFTVYKCVDINKYAPKNIEKPFVRHFCLLLPKIKQGYNYNQKTESIVCSFLDKLHCYWGYFFDNKR